MSLIEQFERLALPTERNVLSAVSIATHPGFRLAVSQDGNPVLLIPSVPGGPSQARNYRLQYLDLRNNLPCSIVVGGMRESGTFSVLSFLHSEREMRHYFLQLASTLIQSLPARPTPKEIVAAISSFVEVLRALSAPPQKTVQGLWAELLVIHEAHRPEVLLDYWHRQPEERFDFNAGVEKLEVKSSSSLERLHYFSMEQLTPKDNEAILIASVYTKIATDGWTLQDLVCAIIAKIPRMAALHEKLTLVVATTLGSDMELALTTAYDYEVARQSVRYYHNHEIRQIEKADVPNGVDQVRFRSDLSLAKMAESPYTSITFLFSAL